MRDLQRSGPMENNRYIFVLFLAEKHHEQIHIEHNSTGHGYEKLFGRCLDERLTEIQVEDPYVRSTHQVTSSKLSTVDVLCKQFGPRSGPTE